MHWIANLAQLFVTNSESKMIAYLLLLAFPIILFLYFQSHTEKKSKHATKLHPPGPPRLPFIGNLHQFDGRHTQLHSLSKQYGPVMSMKLGFRPCVVISSAAVVREIMKSHDLVFSNRAQVSGLKRLSYNGLDVAFSPHGEVWKEMRKISMTHFFSAKRVQSFRPIFREEVSKMMKKISRHAIADSSTVADLSEVTLCFSSNSICRVAFGKSILDDECGKKRYIDLLHEAQPVTGGFFFRDYLPPLGWIDRLSGMSAKLEKVFTKMDSLCDELIKEHMDPNRPQSMEGDTIDRLLGIMRDGSSSINLTLDHIKALIVNIITGGSETSAATLEWAMAALMTKPLVMKKVQTEIRDLGGNKDFIDEEDIEKLPYFRAVVKETFRLFPAGPLLIPRETMNSCTINGYEIEARTTVYINAWAVGRDPEVWEDADEFMPERFVGTDFDLRGNSPKLIPFGIGRRGCPGYGIGMAETELALVNLLYKFDWEFPAGMKEEDVEFDYQVGLAMHKKNPLRLVAKVVVV